MRKNRTISFSVLSGKGGVGKSNLSLNICYALHQMKHSVLLIDCDTGLANMDVLLGITPQQHIQDVLIGDRNPAEVLVRIANSDGVPFDFMPANSGMAEFTELDAGARAILQEKLNPLASNYNFVCLDLGAGISSTVTGLAAMTTLRVVVITPEPTSLTDSYAVMKVLIARHDVQDFYILVNQAESSAEGSLTYNRLAAVCKRFLGFAPAYLGNVRFDHAVVDAVRKQKPFMQVSRFSPAAVDCAAVADALQRLRENILRTQEISAPLGNILVQDF